VTVETPKANGGPETAARNQSAGATPASGLLLVGKFGGAQGIRGEIRIRSYTQDPVALARYSTLLDASGTRTFRIQKARALKEGMLVAQVEGVKDRTAAEALTNIDLYIQRAALPAADEDEFYIADLIGLEARSSGGTRFGAVTQVDNFGAGDILTIVQDEGPEIQLLFNKTNVPDINLDGRWLTIVLPVEIEVREDGQPGQY
jgi:16S rRNA processing protein RimM